MGGILLYLIFERDPAHLIQSFTHDDSFYYLETARRFVAGEGFTFDGRNASNGFHPLWMLMLLPIMALDLQPVDALRVVLAFQVVALLMPSLALVYVAHRRRLGEPGGLAALAAGLWFFPAHQVSAMESGLLVLLFSLLLYLVIDRRVLGQGASVPARMAAGVVLGLAFLARTDSIFLIAGFGLVTLYLHLSTGFGPLSVRARNYLAYILPTAGVVLVTAVPYLVWNVLTHGHLMPISGALKSSLPRLTFSPHYFTLPTMALTAAVIAGGIWGVLRVRRGRSIAEEAGHALMVLAAYVALHAAFTVFAMEWAVFSWHFAAYGVGAATLMAVLAALASTRMRGALGVKGRTWMLAAAGVAVALGVLRSVWAFREQSAMPFYVFSYEAALWANRNLPGDARIAMKDAGAFGYFADASVVNLDGVINNYAYQEALRERGVNAYLSEQGVEYVAQHALWEFPPAELRGYDQIRFPVLSRLHDLPGGEITLYEAEEVYRRQVEERGGRTHFVIWRHAGNATPSNPAPTVRR